MAPWPGRTPGEMNHPLTRSRRLRELILEQLRETVEAESDVEEESWGLFGFLHPFPRIHTT